MDPLGGGLGAVELDTLRAVAVAERDAVDTLLSPFHAVHQ